MIRRDTIYRLAQPRDMRAVHAVLRTRDLDRRTLGWPVVVAVRDGAIIGVLATTPSKKAVVAGPLAVTTAPPIIVAARLIDAYQLVLRMAGVVSFMFHVEDGEERIGWHRFVRAIGAEPMDSKGTGVWYRKRVA